MKRLIVIAATVSGLVFTAACAGENGDRPGAEEQQTEVVTDSLAIEMEELRQDIETTLNELDSLLEEID